MNDDYELPDDYLVKPPNPDEPTPLDFHDVQIGQRWPITRTGERQPIAPELRRLIWTRDGGQCQFCGQPPGELVELDHVIPWSAGGPDTSVNLRCLCHACNTARSNRRTEHDQPQTPITPCCDRCVTKLERFGEAPWQWRRMPGNPEHAAWCGRCHQDSTVTDKRRLL